ncbi:hypothetical protein TNCV_717651 [Trichonephila clavipes]|nr:hypothetical protein TNCV_717651 [Trichonephila clavipes]
MKRLTTFVGHLFKPMKTGSFFSSLFEDPKQLPRSGDFTFYRTRSEDSKTRETSKTRLPSATPSGDRSKQVDRFISSR